MKNRLFKFAVHYLISLGVVGLIEYFIGMPMNVGTLVGCVVGSTLYAVYS